MSREVFPRGDQEKSHYNSSMGLFLSLPVFQLKYNTLEIRGQKLNKNSFSFIGDGFEIKTKIKMQKHQ